MGQGPRKVPRQFPLIFRISRTANGIVRLAREAVSESVQLRAWRAILADQMAVSKFSDLEHRMVEIEEQLDKRGQGHKVTR